MKKVYLLAASVLMIATAYSQGQEKVQQAIQGGSSAQTFPATTKIQTINTDYLGGGTYTHNCKTHELEEAHYAELGYDYDQLLLQNQQEIANSQAVNSQQKTPGTNTISVIFHVVYNTPSENVSNGLIMQVFNDLQEDYQLLNADAVNARTGFGFVPADANINFCLATQTPAGAPLTEVGVERVSTTEVWYDSDNGEENKMKSAITGGANIWDRNKYLNVWICDISNGAGSGTAGYAYRPIGGVLPGSTIDGIVLDYNLGMNNENVLTHEVGHYLGLDHTWGGSGSCSLDDGFTDTPNTAGPSFNYAGSCSGNQTTCGSTQTQYENYMDYANCTCMFTTEQANFMLSVLTGIRSSLLLSTGCDPTNTPPNSAFTADIGSPIIIPVNGTVNLIDQSTNVPTGWSWVISGTAGVNWNYVGGTTAASQNPSVTFLTVGTYNVTLTASNSYGADATPAVQTGYIQVVAASSGTACDTLRNYTSATEDLAAYILEFSGYSDWGYMPGHGAYDVAPPLYNITRYGDRYTASATSQVRRIRIPVLQADDLSTTGFVKVRVHSETGTTPGAVLTTDTMYIADMNAGYWNEFDFTNPATVTGAFWVTFEFFYGSPQDTVIFACVDMADRALTTNVNTMKMMVNGTYYQPQDLYGSTWRTSLYMDVLLSNGAAPVADMIYSDTEVCPGGQIVVNGASSTNTTNYYWYQTDEPVTTVIASSTAGGVTFTFPGPAGDYNIFLYADGSCKTDAIYLPVTVHPAVTASATVTNTTCGYNNGVITVTGASGGTGTYEYSLNGTSWQTSNVFSNLPSGSYTVYVRTTIGNNCDYSFAANVAASTAFTTATVSLNQDICPGGNANITAGGGSTYSWSNGATVIGTTPTVNVTPSVTTSYTCTVTNGTGCQANVTTTVTVDPLDDATFDFFDFCFGASNAAVNIATSGGTFSFNPAPGDGATINATTGEISNEVVGTTYTVQYSSSVVCANTSTQTVFVNTVDDPQFTTASYCSGGTNAVTGIATPGGTFTYNGADASSINASTGVITGGVSGTTYQITYTTPAGVCQSVSAPVSVTVNPTPTVSAVSSQSVCEGSNFTAVTYSGTGGSTFNWSNTNTAVGLAASGSGNIAAFAATGTTTGGSDISGTITVTPVLGSCSGTPQNFTFTVKALPDVQAGSDQTICVGQSVTLAGSGAASYAWDNGVTDGVSFNPAVGSVVYTVTGTGANLCQNTDQVTVTVTNLDDASFVSTDICEGAVNAVTGVVVSGGTFTYDGTDTSAIDPSTGMITGGMLGTTYNVIYTTPAGACQSVSAPVSVTVFANPTLTGTVTNDDGTTNGAIDVTATGGAAPYTYAWDHGPTTEDVTGLAAGSYGVNVTDANGCSYYLAFNVISTVGLESDPLSATLTIYPNPTNGMITVMLDGDFNVMIQDSRGRIVAEKSGNNNLQIDMSSLESAIYFVSVQQDNNVVVKRIVKH
ncbi:MAG: T9SS type A sorting domain-containing protein [Bacteroidetes bacterium]|nr:T9SS type A sorting domain-containing protein [Bacteroidota bacterium]